MKNHGDRLRSLMKSKGFDIQRLSKELKVSRVAVEKDLKRDELTRRTLAKYTGVLFDNFEDFYADKTNVNTLGVKTDSVGYDVYSELQSRYIDLQARFIELQNEHLQLTKRFFPNAAQRATLLS